MLVMAMWDVFDDDDNNDFRFLRGGQMIRVRLSFLWVLLTAAPMYAQPGDSLLVWPSPPETARIAHVQTISSMKDFKQDKGFFAKILSWITGSESSPQWLVQPVGIALLPDGRLLVADPGAGCVHVIDIKKREYEFLRETKNGTFLSPVGIAVGNDGRIYVSDSQRGDISVFDDDLDFVEAIRDQLVRPTGVQIIRGKLYVADTGKQGILEFDPDGKFIRQIGQRGEGDGEFNYPVTVAGKDSLYVVDALNYRVQKFTPDGTFALAIGRHGGVPGSFSSPKSIALDSRGHLYVTDALMDNFHIFTSSGELLLIVGRKGLGNGEFLSPGGIAIDREDNIYVVDTLNKRIQIFRYLR